MATFSKQAIQVINPLLFPGWDDFLRRSPGHRFFHTQGWARVLCESYQYRPLYFTMIEEDRFRALIPVMEIRSILTGRRGVSLPFSDMCQPIIGDAISLPDLMDVVIAFARESRWKYLELRGCDQSFWQMHPSATYRLHTLDIVPDEAQVAASFRSSTRRNINKARNSGVVTRQYDTLEAMESFYHLHCLTRKRHGLPPPPFKFFRMVHRHILQQKRGFVVLAMHQEQTIAGAVFFHFDDEVLYKYGASDMAYQLLRGCNLVMWHAIRWACSNGCKTFQLGRTDPDNQGLLQFKDGWTHRRESIHYYQYDLGKETFVRDTHRLEKAAQRLFGNLSLPLLKVAGKMLYRHVG